jgi:DNA-binding response OmpR family regulator
VWNGDRRIALGTSEWALLLALAQHREAISAEELLTSVWGTDYAGELPFLRLWTERLRINVGDDPKQPQIILGDETSGYRLVE